MAVGVFYIKNLYFLGVSILLEPTIAFSAPVLIFTFAGGNREQY